MVIQNVRINNKKTNYFMTDEEAKILWQYSKRWSSKFQVMLGLALFRGMRIGEICACNLYDFQNDNFQKLNIILEKSHIRDEFPLLAEFNELLKEYILKNQHTMKDGYLFPFYCHRNLSHMTSKTSSAMFSKLRKIIAKDYPQFLDKTEFKNDCKLKYRYRINWHSCRRWFETKIYDKNNKDKMLVRDIMRYRESKTVDVYIDPYEVWKNEQDIINKTFGKLFREFNNLAKGQTKLNAFF